MVWRGHLWLLCGLGEIWLFWVLSGTLISTERPTRAHFSCWRSKLVQGAGTRKGSIEKGQETSFNAEDKIHKPYPPRWIRFTQPLEFQLRRRRKKERVDAGIGSERRQKGRKIKEVVEASWVTRVTCHREPVEQDYSNSLSSLHYTALHCWRRPTQCCSHQQQQAERNTITDPLQPPEEEQ